MTPHSVLIVEDERIIAKGIEKQLKSMSYAVAGSAASGEEAVASALRLQPDLILMDISLGAGIDGIEAASRIRERMDVPIVYLTANSDDATLQRAKLSDPFGYLLKPYEDRDLQTAIEIGLFRHQMEKRLRENEQWLAATLASIGDGVIATDETGRVRLMNTLAESLTGWTRYNAIDRDIREVFNIVHEQTRAEVANPVLEALRTGTCTVLAADTVLIDRSGVERPIDDSAAPIRSANGTISGAVLVFRDISERRRLEEHLRQSQKMEAIGRLAGGVAHDFNNIMTVISGFSELLLLPGQDDDERADSARNIIDAGKRAAALTQQIMAFSRKQVLMPSVLSLNTIVRDMGMLVKRLIGSNIEFVTDLAQDLGHVKADPTQLGQVLLNLAANARDAMPGGGRLVIATRNEVVTDTLVRVHPDMVPGSYALLTVTDTGAGMSDEVAAHAFEPFFTTKDEGQGTGLGLASVYGIVKQSGGDIHVVTAPGAGSTFRIYLPLVRETSSLATGATLAAAEGGTETILLVEDDDGVRKMTRIVLEGGGYRVLEAPDGREAMRIASQHPERIHLLITDLVMPHVSGRETAVQLTASYPALRVLFMSGYNEDVVVHHGVSSGTVDFLRKPFELDALRAKVREMLDRPTPGSHTQGGDTGRSIAT